MSKKKYLWYTDAHFDSVDILNKIKFLFRLRSEKPSGIFLTGDIANGPFTKFYLKILAKTVDCPIYFVLGNHDYWFSSFEETHNSIKRLCKEYPNLIWLNNSDIIPLKPKVALIGTDGWYDGNVGNPDYLKYTIDWLLIKELRNQPSANARLAKFKKIAYESSIDIEHKIQKAIDLGYKTIYILTHYPPWKEATRDSGTFLEEFWLPYNVNYILGKTIENIMHNKKKIYVKILAGHIHVDKWIHVKRNIECKINESKYFGSLRNEEVIYI